MGIGESLTSEEATTRVEKEMEEKRKKEEEKLERKRKREEKRKKKDTESKGTKGERVHVQAAQSRGQYARSAICTTIWMMGKGNGLNVNNA